MKKRPVRLALMVLAAVSVLALASGAAVAEDAVRIEAEMERIIVGVGKTVRIQTEVTPSAARTSRPRRLTGAATSRASRPANAR